MWGIEIRVRQACVSDADVIADFNCRLALESEQLCLDPARVRAGVGALLNDSAKGRYLVAEMDGAIAGQLMLTYEWSDWRNGNIWWLQSVYVKREWRGQGVFRTLFGHVRNLAMADGGVCALRLYMHAENSTARLTYERAGMKLTPYQVYEIPMGGKKAR